MEYLSDIAMRIAVTMEAHAALSTTTAAKADAICDILASITPPSKEPYGAAMIEQMTEEEFNRDRSNENPNVGKGPDPEIEGDAHGEVEGLYITEHLTLLATTEGNAWDKLREIFASMPKPPVGQKLLPLTIAALNPRKETVGVKPLEWQGSGWPRVANTSIGQYQIWADFEVFYNGHVLQTDGLSYETAQSAAQADYDARIRSALTGDTL